jgi:hypothetical protein
MQAATQEQRRVRVRARFWLNAVAAAILRGRDRHPDAAIFVKGTSTCYFGGSAGGGAASRSGSRKTDPRFTA